MCTMMALQLTLLILAGMSPPAPAALQQDEPGAEVRVWLPDEAHDLLAESQELLARGEVQGVLALTAELRGLLSENPKGLAICWLQTARGLQSSAFHDEAVGVLAEAVDLMARAFGEHSMEARETAIELAEYFTALRRHSDAARSYEKAIDALGAEVAEDDLSLLMLLNLAGLAWMEADDLDRARSYFESASEGEARAHGERHPRVAAVRSNLGSCLEALGLHEEALPHYEMAAAVLGEAEGHNPERVAAILNNLALCRQHLGRLEEALPAYEDARELLDDSGVADAAGIRGTLLHNYASCLSDLGFYARALPLRVEAIERIRSVEGPASPTLILALIEHADCLDGLGKPREALERTEEACRLARANLDEEHPYTTLVLTSLAVAQSELGEFEKALENARRALEIRRRRWPGGHPDVASSCEVVASCLTDSGSPWEAEAPLREALEILTRFHRGDHPDVADCLNLLSNCEHDLSRFESALDLCEQALEMRRQLHGGDHPDVAVSLNNQARCLASIGQYRQALTIHEESLAMRRRIHPAGHPAIATGLTTLGHCLRTLGKSKDAFPRYEEALAIRRRLYGADHDDIARGMRNIAACMRDAGRYEESLKEYEAVLDMRQRLFPGDHPKVAISLGDLGAAHSAMGQEPEALALIEQAERMLQRVHKGRDHHDVALALESVGDSLRWLGRSEEALPHMKASLEMIRRLCGEDHPDFADALVSLGACLLDLDQPEEALPRFEAALAILRAAHGDADHLDVASVLGHIGSTHIALEEHAEALSRRREAYDMTVARLGRDHPVSAGMQASLARAYAANGQLEKAHELVSEAVETELRLVEGGDPNLLPALDVLAWYELLQGNTKETVRYLEIAIGILEDTRRGSLSLIHQDRFEYQRMLGRQSIFDVMVKVQLLLGDVDRAFEYLERNRGRGYLDTMEAGIDDPLRMALEAARDGGDLPAEEEIHRLLEGTAGAESEIVGISRRIAVTTGDPGLSQEAREAELGLLRAALVEARTRHRDLLRQRAQMVRRHLPLSRVATLERIQATLAPDEALLAYAFHEADGVLFVVPPEGEGIQVHHVEVGHDELEDKARQLVQRWSRGERGLRDTAPEEPEVDVSTIAWQLFQGLMPDEAWARIRGLSRVYVVPDGGLHRLPLEGLVVADPAGEGPRRHWIDEGQGPPVAYVPSGTALLRFEGRSRELMEERRGRELLALGYASFDPPEPRVEIPPGGALLLGVDEGSAAEEAGLAPLDVILVYDGSPVSDGPGLHAAVKSRLVGRDPAEGATLALEVWRSGLRRVLEVPPGHLGAEVASPSASEAWPDRSALLHETSRRGGRSTRRPGAGGLARLPGTRREVLGIYRLYAGEEYSPQMGCRGAVCALLDSEATETRLFEEIDGARIVHLASHFEPDETEFASYSALALTAPAVPTAEDDGFLSLGELLDPRWRRRLSSCELAVLSACSTNSGPLQRDEGVFSMAWGLASAGVPSMVLSQWRVADDSTAELMVDFHRRLLAGAERDWLHALTEARRELKERYQDPFHWAPFIFIGDPHAR